jgi:hypothetical protein
LVRCGIVTEPTLAEIIAASDAAFEPMDADTRAKDLAACR